MLVQRHSTIDLAAANVEFHLGGQRHFVEGQAAEALLGVHFIHLQLKVAENRAENPRLEWEVLNATLKGAFTWERVALVSKGVVVGLAAGEAELQGLLDRDG
eukprot:GHVO01030281.1.p1 GENE.GHVO01030281.1~~GHVO01030281.1.p1  ORF type:complete len:102 (-),score=8.07 GHVO01030281.1:303-608(-)